MSITVRIPRFSDDANEFTIMFMWPNSDHVEQVTYPVPRTEDGAVDRQSIDQMAWTEYLRVNDEKHDIWHQAAQAVAEEAEVAAPQALAAPEPHPEELRPQYTEDPGTTAPPDFQG